ncbi:hypothetical protein [Mycoplasmopsis cynos]|uniref:hypothetical protein n=1 Tax=Mycoplasmopsis cynos TaxID=171284 RepID=UPI002FF0BAA7
MKKDYATLKTKLDEVENMMRNFANFAAQQNAKQSSDSNDSSKNSDEETATVVEE